MKSGSVVGAALLLVAGGLGGWIVRSWKAPAAATAETDEDAAPEVRPEDMSVEVVTAKAVKGDLPIVLQAVGVVRADKDATFTLSSRAGGRVTQVNYPVGYDVPRGYAVVRFDDAPARLAVAQAKSALAAAANQLDEFDRVGRDRQDAELESAATQAEHDLTTAQAQLDRVLALRADNLASAKSEAEARQAADHARRDRDVAAKALAAFRTAGADLQHSTLAAARDAAEAALKDANAVLADTEVVAPAEAKIITLTVHAGDHADAGASIGTLLLPAGRVLAFGVTPEAAAGIAGGVVNWTDAAGAARTATIRSIAGDVTGPAGLVEIIAVPDGAAPQPGLVVRGEIVLKTLEAVVIVPGAAVVSADDKTCVMVVGDGGIAKRVEVTVHRHGGDAAVEGAVKAGDAVVVEGAYNLPDGAKTHPPEKKDDEKSDEKPESPK